MPLPPLLSPPSYVSKQIYIYQPEKNIRMGARKASPVQPSLAVLAIPSLAVNIASALAVPILAAPFCFNVLVVGGYCRVVFAVVGPCSVRKLVYTQYK